MSEQYISLSDMVKKIYEFVSAGHDGIICVAGARGSGKSSFSRALAHYYARLCEKEFDLKASTYYSRQAFDAKLAGDSYNEIFIVDEALSVLISRQSMVGDQVSLVKRLAICRHRGHLILFNTPSFWNLDRILRGFCSIMFLVEDRPMSGKPSYVKIFRPVSNGFNLDSWNQRLNERMGKRIEKSPNFFGWVVFPDMGELRWFKKLEEEAEVLKLANAQGGVTGGADDMNRVHRSMLIEFYRYVQASGDRIPVGLPGLCASYLGLKKESFIRAVCRSKEESNERTDGLAYYSEPGEEVLPSLPGQDGEDDTILSANGDEE
ncbi:MAG: hypothetical protein ABIJ21_06325 [Nanoarchaeota archaeon]